MHILLPGLIAGLLNIGFIPLIILVARKNEWFDKIDSRKIHTNKTSRLGGVGIFWSFILSLLVSTLLNKTLSGFLNSYWPILLSMFIIHILGLIDDFIDLRARLKFFVQFGTALFIAGMGFRFTNIWIPVFGSLSLGWVSWPLTMLWIVGVLNAINFIDGLDGLSSGISLIAALGAGLILLERQVQFPAVMAFSLVGALAAYLIYNFPPAKIFMGDSGSTFLGLTLAVLPLMDKAHAEEGLWFWSAITLLLVPIFDVFAAILRRRRKGVSMMSPDKWHLHHKLMHFGFSPRIILAIIYSNCLLVALAAVLVLFLGALLYWIIILAAWLLVSTFFLILHYAKERSIAHTPD